MQTLKRFLSDDAGLETVEYAIIAGLIVAGLITVVVAIGTWVIAEVLKLITTQIPALGGGSGISLTAFSDFSPGRRIAYVYWLSLAAVVIAVAVEAAVWVAGAVPVAVGAVVGPVMLRVT